MEETEAGISSLSVACLFCVDHTAKPGRKRDADRDAVWRQTHVGQRNRVFHAVLCMGDTWRIQLNDLCSMAVLTVRTIIVAICSKFVAGGGRVANNDKPISDDQLM